MNCVNSHVIVILQPEYAHSRYAHTCGTKPMTVSPPSKNNTKVNDSMVWTREGSLYQVTEVNGNTVKANPIRTSPLCTDYMSVDLPWEKVGVKEFNFVDTLCTVELSRGDIKGKALRCGNVITLWRPEWVMSKVD